VRDPTTGHCIKTKTKAKQTLKVSKTKFNDFKQYYRDWAKSAKETPQSATTLKKMWQEHREEKVITEKSKKKSVHRRHKKQQSDDTDDSFFVDDDEDEHDQNSSEQLKENYNLHLQKLDKDKQYKEAVDHMLLNREPFNNNDDDDDDDDAVQLKNRNDALMKQVFKLAEKYFNNDLPFLKKVATKLNVKIHDYSMQLMSLASVVSQERERLQMEKYDKIIAKKTGKPVTPPPPPPPPLLTITKVAAAKRKSSLSPKERNLQQKLDEMTKKYEECKRLKPVSPKPAVQVHDKVTVNDKGKKRISFL